MNLSQKIALLFKGILFLVVQIFLFDKIYIFDFPIPSFFVLFLLELPLKINIRWALLIGFTFGLTYDVFNNFAGLNASACVLLVWLRRYLSKSYIISKDLDFFEFPNSKNFGVVPYIVYLVILVFIYNFQILLLEVFSFENLLFIGLNLFLNTTITVIFILIFNTLFRRNNVR